MLNIKARCRALAGNSVLFYIRSGCACMHGCTKKFITVTIFCINIFLKNQHNQRPHEAVHQSELHTWLSRLDSSVAVCLAIQALAYTCIRVFDPLRLRSIVDIRSGSHFRAGTTTEIDRYVQCRC
jgi:hypothetical protein